MKSASFTCYPKLMAPRFGGAFFWLQVPLTGGRPIFNGAAHRMCSPFGGESDFILTRRD